MKSLETGHLWLVVSGIAGLFLTWVSLGGCASTERLYAKPTRIVADEESGTFVVETDGMVEVAKLPDTVSVYTKVNGTLTEGIVLHPGSKLHQRCFIRDIGESRLVVYLPALVMPYPTDDPALSKSYAARWSEGLFGVQVYDRIVREPIQCRTPVVKPGSACKLGRLGAVTIESKER